MSTPALRTGPKPMTRSKRVKTIVQWQVFFYGGPYHTEIHVFGTEEEARAFSAASPIQKIQEGGTVYEIPPPVRKVVYHGGTAPASLRVGEETKGDQRT